MANIQRLASSARQKMVSGQSNYWPDAVDKAIKGTGVFNKNDITRLKRLVLFELSRYRKRPNRRSR